MRGQFSVFPLKWHCYLAVRNINLQFFIFEYSIMNHNH